MGVSRKWPGPFFRSATCTPSTTIQSRPMEGISRRPIASPPAIGGVLGAVGMVDVVDGGGGSLLEGAAVVVVAGVVVATVVVFCRAFSNSFSRSCWARAVCNPVPHSW